jgi:hypothetical protein
MPKYIEEGDRVVDREISDIRKGQFTKMLNAPRSFAFDECEFNNYKRSLFAEERSSDISNVRGDIKRNHLPVIYSSAPTMATSISPRDIHKQQQSIQSWLNIGFNVVSMNCGEEIQLIEKYFPEVGFVQTKRDAREFLIKPFVFIDDLFDYLKKTDAEVCGIVNSDIFLIQDMNFIEFIQKEATNSALYGPRIEVDSFETLQGNVYERGFDVFFFPKSAISEFPKSELCIGATWWDYWIPLILSLKGYSIKRIKSPFAFHKKHQYNWDREQFVLLGKKVFDFLHEHLANEENLISLNNPWISFNIGFLSFFNTHFSEKAFSPNEKALLLFRYYQCFADYVLNFLRINSAELTYHGKRKELMEICNNG